MVKNYFISAYRSLARKKAFSLINISGLTMGLTACLLIGLFIYDELAYDKFISENDRVFRIVNHTGRDDQAEVTPRTPPRFGPALEQEIPEVNTAARIREILSVNLFTVGDKKIYESGGMYASEGFFEIFSLPFKYGSPGKALEDPSSIVISEEMADKFFEEDDPVGKEIIFGTTPLVVKGVLKNKDLKFHLDINYIMPLIAAPVPEEGMMESWAWQQFNTYVKLKEGVDPKKAEEKFQRIIEAQAFPALEQYNISYMPFFQPLDEIYLHSANFKIDMAVRGNITYVRALGIIAIFILLIACFNFINLATANSLRRAKEVGVRKSIGASRKQLIVQFLGESYLFAVISMLLSLALTIILISPLNHFTDKEISLNIFAQPVPLLLLIGATLFIGLFAGFYPALVLSKFQPVKVLKSATANHTMPGKIQWLRHGLVVVQFSLSVLLIIASLIVYEQVSFLNTKDLGFDKEEIMFFPMRGEEMYQNYETFKKELNRVPGVSSVSMGYGFPGDITAGDGIMVPKDGENIRHSVTQILTDHDYVETLNIKLVAGRDFQEETSTDKNQAFLINESAVKELGFDTPENAIGQPLLWSVWGTDTLKRGEVIGVVKDFHINSLYDKIRATVIQIFPDAYWKVAVKLKSSDLSGTIADVKEVWNAFSPEFPIEYKFLDENFEQMYRAEEKLKTLLLIFTGLAIFLGCLGLFGLAAYAAEKRTKEIGVRKILGASVRDITVLLSKEFIILMMISLIIASPLAWYAMDSYLQNFAYRIDISGRFFAMAGFLAIIFAFTAVSFHVIKAALKNPVENLRTE